MTSLYRLYDSNKILLYVGITDRRVLRQSEHAASQDWWDLVVRQKFAHYQRHEEAVQAERLAIKTELPIFNRIHAAIGWQERRELYRAGHMVDVLKDVQSERRAKSRRNLLIEEERRRGNPLWWLPKFTEEWQRLQRVLDRSVNGGELIAAAWSPAPILPMHAGTARLIRRVFPNPGLT